MELDCGDTNACLCLDQHSSTLQFKREAHACQPSEHVSRASLPATPHTQHSRIRHSMHIGLRWVSRILYAPLTRDGREDYPEDYPQSSHGHGCTARPHQYWFTLGCGATAATPLANRCCASL